MKCSICGMKTRVLETRVCPDQTVRRRRACKNGHRQTTWEAEFKPRRPEKKELIGNIVSDIRKLANRLEDTQ